MILIFKIYFRSNVCVEALAKCETIAPLKRAMNLRKDLIYAACETFSTIFGGHHDTLVKQVSYSLYLFICELFKAKTPYRENCKSETNFYSTESPQIACFWGDDLTTYTHPKMGKLFPKVPFLCSVKEINHYFCRYFHQIRNQDQILWYFLIIWTFEWIP